jgi:hypothetical protein
MVNKKRREVSIKLSRIREKLRERLELLSKDKKTKGYFSNYSRNRNYNKKYASAKKEAYEKFGRKFLGSFAQDKIIIKKAGRQYIISKSNPSFESEHGVVIRVISKDSLNKRGVMLARISLGFLENTLIVEAMQTGKEVNNRLNEFRRESKETALDFILKEIEKRAKSLGFNSISIRKPEMLYYYNNPSILSSENISRKEIQRNMRKLYSRIAKRNAYERTARFFTKKIN